MGLFDFIMNAGKSIGIGKQTNQPSQSHPDPELEQKLKDQRITGKLLAEVNNLGLGAEKLDIQFKNGKVSITGTTSSQENREKLILALGNIEGVGQVSENIVVEKTESKTAEAPEITEAPQSVFYTVQKGDSLSKIAKMHYGNANKYNIIFEANKPMLASPDKIYPGQVLRIPPLG
ncbi:MAG: peptidoglycan-binding protein LysM [Candidatus Schekmanbacteria bacterium RBG_13_48_7]|uniref:Potassium binding protein Kbp n=1 Tax=Candidatus Schekmanbacteria bacterium RBG_13_48_7 TaxID=1817878 RepID=A0A1F7S1V2_9BACT|nr:MAG: peptidoglycan-binding protein LysM [Candidatus Schekmanbacteria bacterium RBG_13_48_7]